MNVHEKDRKSAPAAHERNTEPRAHENDAFVVSSSSSLSELKPLVLKHGDAFGVFDSKGDALASPGGTAGRLLLRHPPSVAFLDHAERPAPDRC